MVLLRANGCLYEYKQALCLFMSMNLSPFAKLNQPYGEMFQFYPFPYSVWKDEDVLRI